METVDIGEDPILILQHLFPLVFALGGGHFTGFHALGKICFTAGCQNLGLLNPAITFDTALELQAAVDPGNFLRSP